MTCQKQIDVKVKTLLISIGLLFVFFGCDNAPRVRLVKDDDHTFHFQWAEPLKEERIILIHYSGLLVLRGREIPFRNLKRLVHFPAGTFVSSPVKRHDSGLRIDSVVILQAYLRETALPADAYQIGGGGRFLRRGDRILREHPLFREYRVAPPARIIFSPEPSDEPDSPFLR